MDLRLANGAVAGVLFFGFALAFADAAAPLTAREIMDKSEDARRVREMEASSVLETVRADGTKKEKRFRFWRKAKGQTELFNTLTRFESPAEVKGEKILFLENAEGKNDIFLYLPAYKKVRRVERAQQSGAFMGSDLSYSDLTTQHAEDYEFKLLREEKCPTPEAAAIDCYVIGLKPKPAVSERTGYGSGTDWVRKDNFMGVKAVYQDLEGKDFKEVTSGKIEMVDPQAKKYFAHEIRVKNLKTGSQSAMIFSSVKANGGIKDAIFTQQSLQSEK